MTLEPRPTGAHRPPLLPGAADARDRPGTEPAVGTVKSRLDRTKTQMRATLEADARLPLRKGVRHERQRRTRCRPGPPPDRLARSGRRPPGAREPRDCIRRGCRQHATATRMGHHGKVDLHGHPRTARHHASRGSSSCSPSRSWLSAPSVLRHRQASSMPTTVMGTRAPYTAPPGVIHSLPTDGTGARSA